MVFLPTSLAKQRVTVCGHKMKLMWRVIALAAAAVCARAAGGEDGTPSVALVPAGVTEPERPTEDGEATLRGANTTQRADRELYSCTYMSINGRRTCTYSSCACFDSGNSCASVTRPSECSGGSSGSSYSSYNVRLVGGSNSYEGRVEIHYNGQWGTVCDDSFGNTDATVVCRQLFGSQATGTARCCAAYGRGSGSIWMDDVGCSSSNSALRYCSHRGWGVHNCGHSEDVGVRCTLPPSPSPRPYCTENQVRLTGSSSSYSGRVEICHNNQWGTVCDDFFDNTDATVVCKQLFGSHYTGTARSRAYYGAGTGTIWMDNVGCSSSNTRLHYCSHRGWGVHDCGHSEDAGVSCTRASSSSGDSSDYSANSGSSAATSGDSGDGGGDVGAIVGGAVGGLVVVGALGYFAFRRQERGGHLRPPPAKSITPSGGSKSHQDLSGEGRVSRSMQAKAKPKAVGPPGGGGGGGGSAGGGADSTPSGTGAHSNASRSSAGVPAGLQSYPMRGSNPMREHHLPSPLREAVQPNLDPTPTPAPATAVPQLQLHSLATTPAAQPTNLAAAAAMAASLPPGHVLIQLPTGQYAAVPAASVGLAAPG